MKNYVVRFDRSALPNGRLKEPQRSILLKMLGGREDCLEKIETAASGFLADEQAARAAYESPADIKNQLAEFSAAVETLESVWIGAAGSARALILGELAHAKRFDLCDSLDRLTDAAEQLKHSAQRAAMSIEPKRGGPKPDQARAARLRLATAVAIQARATGLVVARDAGIGSFADVLGAVYEAIGIDATTERDIRAIIESGSLQEFGDN